MNKDNNQILNIIRKFRLNKNINDLNIITLFNDIVDVYDRYFYNENFINIKYLKNSVLIEGNYKINKMSYRMILFSLAYLQVESCSQAFDSIDVTFKTTYPTITYIDMYESFEDPSPVKFYNCITQFEHKIKEKNIQKNSDTIDKISIEISNHNRGLR